MDNVAIITSVFEQVSNQFTTNATIVMVLFTTLAILTFTVATIINYKQSEKKFDEHKISLDNVVDEKFKVAKQEIDDLRESMKEYQLKRHRDFMILQGHSARSMCHIISDEYKDIAALWSLRSADYYIRGEYSKANIKTRLEEAISLFGENKTEINTETISEIDQILARIEKKEEYSRYVEKIRALAEKHYNKSV